jgi:hypothetical protein
MISNALNIGAAASPGLPDPAVGSRGEPNHPMSWSDLVEFGRSPHRWRFWRPEPDERSWTWEDIVRGYAVVPSLATRQFTPRPRTYPAMVNTCPGCRSTGVAETCRKCGLRRRMVSAERPWAGTAEYCRNWTEATIKAGSFVVSADDHDRALAAVDKLNADQAVASTRTEASVWQTFSATWHDADTGLDIPVRADVQIVPEESTNLSDVLAGVYVSRNAAPGPWAIQVIGRQAHVEAALLLDIVSLARGASPRPSSSRRAAQPTSSCSGPMRAA